MQEDQKRIDPDQMQGMLMRKYDPDKPHGPDNTVFYQKGTEKEGQEKNTEKDANRICKNCDKPFCTASGAGCPAYRKAWAEN